MKSSQPILKLVANSDSRLKQIEVERTTLQGYIIDNLKNMGARRMMELMELVEDLNGEREQILQKLSKGKREAGMFQFTLRAARISSGYSIEEAANVCGLSSSTLHRYEKDSGRIPRPVALALGCLYGVSIDLVYFGKESECIEHNRRRAQDHGFK
jgi:DNA-binding XRE family transcriptional regulator